MEGGAASDAEGGPHCLIYTCIIQMYLCDSSSVLCTMLIVLGNSSD